MKYFRGGITFTEDSTRSFVSELAMKNIDERTFVHAICVDETVVGFIGAWPELLGHTERTEVGYGMIPAMTGKGFATNALKLALSICSGPMFATTHPENLASAHVLEKCGFSKDISRQNVMKSFDDSNPSNPIIVPRNYYINNGCIAIN